MNKKDLKKLAKQIANLEIRLQVDNLSNEERVLIESEIEVLCMKVHSLDEMDLLDELIQKNLNNF